MAASDPTPYVATPTGTLQGAAAFSWDGSAWQPTGRAGPDVATPTGVLQGVAPFAWDGSAWQPSGRVQPGVAAPGGALDGVAVYIWSGSAWTPASGTATPSTPSGALRGVAAFSWDGAAWQPAAQARASVPTPYGVLDGVAMFEWGGSSWQAGGAVPAGATLDLSFLGGTLNPLLTFTRASTATYFDSSGVMQTAVTNAPRFDCDPVTHVLRGLLIEDQRQNVALYRDFTAGWAPSGLGGGSAADTAPDGTVTVSRWTEDSTNGLHYLGQNPTLVASTSYTLSVFAKASGTRYLQLDLDNGGADGAHATFDLQTGSVTGALTARGAAAIGTATIQAVGNGYYRCAIVTTIGASTTGRLLLFGSNIPAPGFAPGYQGNPANSVLLWGAQLEAGAFSTSYIPTTSTAVTRSQDRCGIPSANMGWFVSPGGSWMAEFIRITNPLPGDIHIISGPTEGNLQQVMNQQGNGCLQTYDGNNWTATVNTVTANVVSRGATSWGSSVGHACLNGGAMAPALAMTSGFGALTASGVGFLTTSPTPGSSNNMTGYIRRVRYWPRMLSDAEMQQVTT